MDDTGQDRRRSSRKQVNFPVKIIIQGNVAAVGHVVDMSSFGVKIETLLKISKGQATLNELLSAKEVVLEIGHPGGNTLNITASAGIKWHTYNCGETEEIYIAGMELTLNAPEKDEWQQTYEGI